MTFIIETSRPEDVRDEIAKQLDEFASRRRRAANVAKRKGAIALQMEAAAAHEFAAMFVRSIVIRPKLPEGT